MRPRLALALLALAASLPGSEPAATPASPSPVGPDAVWSPPEGFRSAFQAACGALGGKEFSECFVARMQKAGASEAALAFVRRTGGMGYLAQFRETGKVDVAYAEYPFRANENQVCFLVNGDPPLIDVDDPARIDRKALEANPSWTELRKSFPKLALFPAPRGGGQNPRAVTRKSGGQQFVVIYSLTDGCHACKTVGYVRVAFDFDVAGKFLGTEIEQVRARYH
jgi:hypothetical protein